MTSAGDVVQLSRTLWSEFMPPLLAIEWDETQARVAVASQHGGRMVVQQAFSVALQSSQMTEEEHATPIGRQIATALRRRGIGRADALVAVGRGRIELRQLSLPPAPEEELPELVRFQAMREFNELTDEWLLDFVPVGEPTDASQEILAAAIDPQLVGQIKEACRTAGLEPQRLVLRPCAAAALLGTAADSQEDRVRMLVDLLPGEVDLTVMAGSRVAFLRTTRLAVDVPEKRALVMEIRRTMAAAQNQLGGRRVESILLCGTGEEQVAQAKALGAALHTATELFDPFSVVEVAPRLRGALPETPGRFAALLGMLATEAENRQHAVDFLHPRQPPQQASRRHWYIAAAVAVVLLMFGFLVVRRLQQSHLAAEIAGIEKQLPEWEKKERKARSLQTAAAKIKQWTASDVVWLDQLAELSVNAPPARDVMATEMLFNALPGGGGQIYLKGLAKDAATIQAVEQRIRDSRRSVESGESSEDDSQPYYSWWFGTRVTIEPEEGR